MKGVAEWIRRDMRGERASRDSACVVDRGARSARMLGFWKGRNRRLPTAAARLRRPISRDIS